MRAFFFIFLFCWLFNLFLPWWSTLIPALFFGAWMLEKSTSAFAAGFSAAGLAWFVQAFYIHIQNEAILSTRIAEMLGVGSPWIVLFLTLVTGGIIGAMGALTGVQLKHTFKPASAAKPGHPE